MAARKAEIDAELLKLDPDKTYAGDGVELSFTPVRGLDNVLIEKRFPPSRRPELYKITLDTKEVRKAFSANELAKYESTTTRINVKGVE